MHVHGLEKKEKDKHKHQIRLNWTIKNDCEIDPNNTSIMLKCKDDILNGTLCKMIWPCFNLADESNQIFSAMWPLSYDIKICRFTIQSYNGLYSYFSST